MEMTRAEMRRVACPECDAGPGERCRGAARKDGVRKHRESNHLERQRAATRRAGIAPFDAATDSATGRLGSSGVVTRQMTDAERARMDRGQR